VGVGVGVVICGEREGQLLSVTVCCEGVMWGEYIINKLYTQLR
jgi:hypothetical protein